MTLLFWNLFKNNNASYLSSIIKENDIDIAVCAEYLVTDIKTVEKNLSQYDVCYGYGGNDKIIMLSKNSVNVSLRQEQSRYSIYICEQGNFRCIIAGIHLPANPGANSEARKNIIRDLVADISEVEKELKLDNTIVIGDFNASPFDDELIQKDTFNAVLFKDLIMEHEKVLFNRKYYKRFYNPHISVISEEKKHYGSFYYSNGINSLYWYSYDQIIVRKPLVNLLEQVWYCKYANGKPLINQIAPNKQISDHLPLIARLKTGANNNE